MTKIRERHIQLEKSTIMRQQLLAVLIHDLRSQLYAHNFLLEHLCLEGRKLSPDTMFDTLYELLESGKIIQKMCSDFLVWIDSQKEVFTVTRKAFCVEPFLASIALLYRQTALNMGIQLTFDAEEGLVVVTDENLLAIVLRNIIDNAIRHSGSRTILIVGSSAAGKLQIRVADTGRGMHPEMIRELRAPARPVRSNGSNFGYRFIREFSMLLGAEIEIDSHEGKGTTVTVTLPAEEQDISITPS